MAGTGSISDFSSVLRFDRYEVAADLLKKTGRFIHVMKQQMSWILCVSVSCLRGSPHLQSSSFRFNCRADKKNMRARAETPLAF